jgi:hypothetical protein
VDLNGDLVTEDAVIWRACMVIDVPLLSTQRISSISE